MKYLRVETKDTIGQRTVEYIAQEIEKWGF